MPYIRTIFGLFSGAYKNMEITARSRSLQTSVRFRPPDGPSSVTFLRWLLVDKQSPSRWLAFHIRYQVLTNIPQMATLEFPQGDSNRFCTLEQGTARFKDAAGTMNENFDEVEWMNYVIMTYCQCIYFLLHCLNFFFSCLGSLSLVSIEHSLAIERLFFRKAVGSNIRTKLRKNYPDKNLKFSTFLKY